MPSDDPAGTEAEGHHEGDSRYESSITVLERARTGDPDATLVLLERTVAPLRRWARRRLPDYARAGADTEDVVQDVVVRALAGIKTFEHRTVDALQAYLRESVRNRIRDEIRRVARRGISEQLREDLPDDAYSPVERMILREDSQRYLDALRKLKPADRVAVVYRLEHRYPFEEIARRMGKPSADAARIAVSRAVKRLATEVGVMAPDHVRRSGASAAADPGGED